MKGREIVKFKTKLWKRSNKSFATTIPHIALLEMDESKEHDIIWEYNAKLQKWCFELRERRRNREVPPDD